MWYSCILRGLVKTFILIIFKVNSFSNFIRLKFIDILVRQVRVYSLKVRYQELYSKFCILGCCILDTEDQLTKLPVIKHIPEGLLMFYLSLTISGNR